MSPPAAPRRLARLAGRILRSNVAELPRPYRLTFALTYRCQARCVMCNIWRKPAARELSLEEIDATFRISPGFSWINLTGGELSLRDDLVPVVRAIDRRCRDLCLLNFPTNGFLTEKIVAAVAEIAGAVAVPRLVVTVSLDGPRDLHDRIRGLEGSWDRALATFDRLRALRSRRFSVYLGFTLQAANLHAFSDTVAAARATVGDIAPDDFHVNLAHVSRHYYDNAGFAGLADPIEAQLELSRIRASRGRRTLDPVAFLERRYQRFALDYERAGAVPLTCQAGAASLFLDPCGTVYPCTGLDAPIGSLREAAYDLYAIWDGARRRDTRAAIIAGSCPRCWTPCEAYQTILANLSRRGGRP